jgi:hypothetical protein
MVVAVSGSFFSATSFFVSTASSSFFSSFSNF